MSLERGARLRRSIRLKDFDYSQPGGYVVTICAHGGRCLFGEIADGEMQLSAAGSMVRSAWECLPNRFAFIRLDEFVVMPNHLHGIIVLTGESSRSDELAEGEHKVRPYGTLAGTVSRIVQAFKSMTTHEYAIGVNHGRWAPFSGRLWQRSYYEHIIRNEDDLQRVRRYINENPVRWPWDEENPERG
jgi:REP element-mobilizing transposase RayT